MTSNRVIPWAERNRDLASKLHRLYEANWETWLSTVGNYKFREKWHVGRAMMAWFYGRDLLTAEEFDALQELHSRPNKPDYEMYRIVWKDAGRSSDRVAAICTAKRRGPPKPS